MQSELASGLGLELGMGMGWCWGLGLRFKRWLLLPWLSGTPPSHSRLGFGWISVDVAAAAAAAAATFVNVKSITLK